MSHHAVIAAFYLDLEQPGAHPALAPVETFSHLKDRAMMLG
jgi:hypothetical protein